MYPHRRHTLLSRLHLPLLLSRLHLPLLPSRLHLPLLPSRLQLPPLLPSPSPVPPPRPFPILPRVVVSTLVASTCATLSLPIPKYVRPPRALFFNQNGVAGACGQVHSDSDFICAIGECSLMAGIRAT